MKTTPKPRATKKRRGELVGPLLEVLPEVLLGEGDAIAVAAADVDVAIEDVVICVPALTSRSSPLSTILSISTNT